jgi:hypothetical protein
MYKVKVNLYEYQLSSWYRDTNHSLQCIYGGKCLGFNHPRNGLTVYEVLETPVIPEGYVATKDINIIQKGFTPLSNVVYTIEIECSLPEGWVKMDNGSFLHNAHGKYQPALTILNSTPEMVWLDRKPSDFNLEKGEYSIIIGDYFVSKKGNNCFQIKNSGKHILIKDNWGGAFNKYKGGSLVRDEALYYKEASSNGGGSGYDYGIFNRNWTKSISMDDI